MRCPKCDNFILFDETKYGENVSLVFRCTRCGKEFGIHMGVSRLYAPKNGSGGGDSHAETPDNDAGSIVVVGNVFCFKQVLPLRMGDNIIGSYQKGGHAIQCPIESSDPSLDMRHCVLSVSRAKHGGLKYTLRDGPSFTGTFVGGELLAKRERREIADGTLFTLGATSIILKTKENKS